MEDLPLELLERVLAVLAPADLVVVRAVCRRWHAAVAALAQRDRAFAYRCGHADIATVAQRTGFYFVDSAYSENEDLHLACTCGAVVPNTLWHIVLGVSERTWDEATRQRVRDEVARALYKDRHAVPWPPARWELLVRERAIAMHMVDLGSRLATDLQRWDYVPQGSHYSCTYIPAWVHLPAGLPRPTTVPALVALVNKIFSCNEYRDVVERLAARPGEALQFYADVVAQREEQLRNPLKHLRYDRYLERQKAFFAGYANGPAIVAAAEMQTRPQTAMDEFGQRAGLDTALEDASAIRAAMADMEAAFSREETRTGHGPDDPLIADAEWHDAWMQDDVVLQDPPGSADEDGWKTHFQTLVQNMGECGWDRLPPFNYDTTQRIRYSDPSGWSELQRHARAMAATVRRCLLKGRRELLVGHFGGSYYLKRENVDWDSKTDAELLEVADRMVHTTDAVKEAFAACCTLPVVVRLDSSRYMEWFGGLSPAGHLVGTMTVNFHK